MKYLKIIRYSLPLIVAMLITFAASAQAENGTGQPEMADFMWSNGKIFVVVGALVIIFSGIVIYLFSLNAKLSKLEKLIRDTKK